MSWEVIDDNEIIHSSNNGIEMKRAFDIMTMDEKAFIEEYSITLSQYKEWESEFNTDWSGDLKLIEVHEIYR